MDTNWTDHKSAQTSQKQWWSRRLCRDSHHFSAAKASEVVEHRRVEHFLDIQCFTEDFCCLVAGNSTTRQCDLVLYEWPQNLEGSSLVIGFSSTRQMTKVSLEIPDEVVILRVWITEAE